MIERVERVERVVVLVPVRDEEATVGACLRSVVAAARACPVPVDILALLDSCIDGTERIVDVVAAEAADLGIFRISGRWNGCNKTRADGALLALAVDASETWLATTDADSTVPADWLTRQLEHAAEGASAVFGAGRIEDWSEWPEGSQEAFERAYSAGGFVHGFNLGVRASALRAVGGFSTTLNEDAALRNDLIDAGHPVVFDRSLVVTTSGRRVGRCKTGFSIGIAETIARGHALEAP